MYDLHSITGSYTLSRKTTLHEISKRITHSKQLLFKWIHKFVEMYLFQLWKYSSLVFIVIIKTSLQLHFCNSFTVATFYFYCLSDVSRYISFVSPTLYPCKVNSLSKYFVHFSSLQSVIYNAIITLMESHYLKSSWRCTYIFRNYSYKVLNINHNEI